MIYSCRWSTRGCRHAIKTVQLTEQKMWATNCRKRNTISTRVGCYISTSSTFKYLGMMIYAKINFKGRLDYNSCEKAGNKSVWLARMMPNIGGPIYSRRLFVDGVIRSTLLYAEPVWEEPLACEWNWSRVSMAYRFMGLRFCIDLWLMCYYGNCPNRHFGKWEKESGPPWKAYKIPKGS